jgi:hypothetical protein
VSDVSSSYAPAFPPSARLPVDARFFLGVDDLATASLYSHLNLFLKFPLSFYSYAVCAIPGLSTDYFESASVPPWPPPFALIDIPPRHPRFLQVSRGCCEPRPWPPRTGFFVNGLFCCAWPNESAPARGRQQLGPTALIVIRRALKITTGQTYCLDWTSTRIATATIATAMNIQYWIRTPKMSKPSTRTCMAIAPFAGRDFHSMFIASKPSRLHPPTTFAAKLRWLSRCAVFTFSMANILRRVVRALALARPVQGNCLLAGGGADCFNAVHYKSYWLGK